MGAVMIPVMSVGFVGLERAEVAHASIITRLAQQVGGAFGTALLAVILASTTGGASSAAELAHGFDTAFWWAVGFTVLAIVVCFALPSRPGAAPATSQAPSPAGARGVPRRRRRPDLAGCGRVVAQQNGGRRSARPYRARSRSVRQPCDSV